jgi:hypothetical protein
MYRSSPGAGHFRLSVHVGRTGAALMLVRPSWTAFPATDELARVAAGHDIAAIGPPMTSAEADAIIERAARR